MGGGVETVLGGQEHRPGGEHDGRVIEDPRVIESDEVVDSLRHKRMPLLGKHEVIGNADRYRFGEDDGVCEEGVEGSKATNVQIDVHAAIVVEDEIPNGVGSLDGVGVSVEGVQEPGVMLGNEHPGTRVRPEHILAKNDAFSTRRANEKGSRGDKLTSRASSLYSHPKRPSTVQGGCLFSKFGAICVGFVRPFRAGRRSISSRDLGR